MDHTNMQHHQLPAGVRSALTDFRKRVWRIKVAEGIFAAVCGLVVSYLIVFALDRIVETTGWMRGGILLVGSLGIGLLLPMKLHRWVWQTRKMEQVARLVRKTFSTLGDEMLSAVELARYDAAKQLSPVLVKASLAQVEQRVEGKDLSGAIPKPRHLRWAFAAALPLAVAIVVACFVPTAGGSSFWRWLTPWQDLPRFTFARFGEIENEKIVAYGEPTPFRVALATNSDWKPEAATMSISKMGAQRSALNNGAYEFELPPMVTDSTLNVRAADATATVNVKPVARPELAEIAAQVELPEYLQYSQLQQLDFRGSAVAVLRGSRARFVATATRDLQSIQWNDQALNVSSDTFQTPFMEITDSTNNELSWVDSYNLSGKDSLKLRVLAVDDMAPQVACRGLQQQQVVLSTDLLKYEIDAKDDFGLKLVGLEWQGVRDALTNPEPQSGEKIVAAGGPETNRLSKPGTFSIATEKLRPQTLHVRAFTEDYKPGRERSYSVTYTLHVLSPEDHQEWISEQLRLWAQNADAAYEQELLLHGKNRDLRARDPDELQSPAGRRELQEQAAAERANGARLSQLTNSGIDLLRQARRNEQMRAEQLARWASALGNLQDIAEDRMPSVADLLTQAALDPGKKENSEKENSQGDQAEPDSSSQSPPPIRPEGQDSQQSPEGPKDDPNNPGSQKPSIQDNESGSSDTKPESSDSPDQNAKPLTIPNTQLAPVPQDNPDKPQQPDTKKQPPAPLDEAVDDQRDLLDDFEKSRDELQGLMNELDNSTFVKRLKAASQIQSEIANAINDRVYSVFGLPEADLAQKQSEQVARIAERESAQSDNVREIYSDLEAYQNREPDPIYKKVLDQMRDYNAVTKLDEISKRVAKNFVGDSLSRAEYWSDTLDRWAEELVPPQKNNQNNQDKNKQDENKDLPPSILLEIMRILDDEKDLREQTRELDQAENAMPNDEYQERAFGQTIQQMSIQERTLDTIDDIKALPQGEQDFANELTKLTASVEAMDEAQQVLSVPDTGPNAIAAETAAIEALLEAERGGGGGGGGGGGDSPGGGGAGPEGNGNANPLALLGDGSGAKARVTPRLGSDSTGLTGKDLPGKYRQGLDSFFNRLQQLRDSAR